MLSKILTSESKTVTGAAVVLAATTLLSRGVGVIRDRVFAHYFGTSPIMDAYYAAFKIPDFIFSLLIVGALTAGFIPTFAKLLEHNDNRSSAWRLANNVINILGISLIIICGLGIIFAPFLARGIAPGFEGESLQWIGTFTRIMFLSPLILGISMVLGGVLQSLRQFLLYSIAPIFYNLGITIGATLFVSFMGPSGLAWGVVLGALMHASIQCVGAYRNGYRWKWILNFKDIETRLIGRLMVPRTIGLAITQLNTVITTVLASFLPVGSVTVYSLATNLQSVPNGVIGVSFAVAAFPVLANAIAREDGPGFVECVARTIRQVLFLMIPISLIILLLPAQIVRVIYGTGQFDWAATRATANTLSFFALGLFAQSLLHLLARAFYALSDTKTPLVIGIISELISIIAALLLMKPLGVAGLALAFSIGNIIHMSLLFITLRSVTSGLQEGKLLSMFYRVSVAGIVMAVVVIFTKNVIGSHLDLNRFWEILLQGVVSGTLGILVYGAITYALKTEEMLDLIGSFKKRLFKTRDVPVEVEGL